MRVISSFILCSLSKHQVTLFVYIEKHAHTSRSILRLSSSSSLTSINLCLLSLRGHSPSSSPSSSVKYEEIKVCAIHYKSSSINNIQTISHALYFPKFRSNWILIDGGGDDDEKSVCCSFVWSSEK